MRKLVMVLSILAVLAMAVLNLAYSDGIKADVVYEMANQNIEWHYAGK